MKTSASSIKRAENSDLYHIRGTPFTFKKDSLYAARIAFGFFFVLGGVGSLIVYFEKSRYSLPDWALPLGGTFTAVTGVTLIGSKLLVRNLNPENTPLFQNRNPSGARLHSISQLPRQFSLLLDELCERDEQGKEITSTPHRINEILAILKTAHKLSYLNAIPNYYFTRQESCFPGSAPPYYTPLHYWAKKGDLTTVKLLIEQGAKDYFTEGSAVDQLVTGLYLAAKGGHLNVVQYLLQKGSPIDIAFSNQNVLCSFLPKLIFEMTQLLVEKVDELEANNLLECLKIILSHLGEKNKQNLQFQLRIPIRENVNILDWIVQEYSTEEIKIQQRIKTLENLLQLYVTEKDVFSIKELQEKGYNVGNGFTLYERSTLK